MTLFLLLLLLAILAVAGIAGTMRELWLDRPRAIPQSRQVDPDTVPPSQRVLS